MSRDLRDFDEQVSIIPALREEEIGPMIADFFDGANAKTTEYTCRVADGRCNFTHVPRSMFSPRHPRLIDNRFAAALKNIRDRKTPTLKDTLGTMNF